MASRIAAVARRCVHLSTVTRSLARTEKTGEQIDATRARLLYQSKKRGILENDILLGDFASENLGKMNRNQLTAYDKLINGEHMEWDLFYYLSGKKSPPEDVESCDVYKMVKSYVDAKRVPPTSR